MAQIENTDVIAEELGRWSPGDLAFITRLTYSPSSPESDSELILEGLMQKRERCQARWPSNELPTYAVSMEFAGVRDLKINGVGGNPGQVMGFDIVDVSEDRWESIKFHVLDYEDGKLEFYCSSVRILAFGAHRGFPLP